MFLLPVLPDAMLSFVLDADDVDPVSLFDKTLLISDVSLKLTLLKILKTFKKLVELYTTSSNKGMECDLGEEMAAGLQVLDMLRDAYIWEHLNIGHWKSVESCWRRSYTFVCILKAIFMAVTKKPFVDIVKECDMGLMMGEPVLDNVLLKFVENLSQIIIKSRRDEHFSIICKEIKDENIKFQEVCLRLQFPESRFDIKCAENPTLEYFSKFMKNKTPLLISKSIEHWPARKKWNVNYIQHIAGFRTVPVEIGSKYTSEDWTQKLMTIDEFIKIYIENKSESGVGYIAQHRLFDQITELKSDIKIPEYCLLGEESKDVDINGWFGPSGTISPTHFDPKHNLLVQIFGYKLIRLYPPSETEFLRPFPSSSILFNTSQLDLEDKHLHEKFPDFKNAKYTEFLLTPGMILYIPPKWWHYVKSLTPSFSISYWFE